MTQPEFLPPEDRAPEPTGAYTLGEETITVGCGLLFLVGAGLSGLAAISLASYSLSSIFYSILTLVAWSLARNAWGGKPFKKEEEL